MILDILLAASRNFAHVECRVYAWPDIDSDSHTLFVRLSLPGSAGYDLQTHRRTARPLCDEAALMLDSQYRELLNKADPYGEGRAYSRLAWHASRLQHNHSGQLVAREPLA